MKVNTHKKVFRGLLSNQLGIEISGIIDMIGLAALAGNFLVGICIWSNVNYPLPYQLTFLQLHKLTGYTAAITILVHIVLIPLDPLSGFSWTDLLLRARTEHQPLANTFGSVAFYLVIISSYYKSRIALKSWRFCIFCLISLSFLLFFTV